MCSLGGNRKNRPGRTLTAAWLNRYGPQGILRLAEKTDFRRHSTPLEGMNTIKFCWQKDKNCLSEGIIRPLRLTKTTGRSRWRRHGPKQPRTGLLHTALLCSRLPLGTTIEAAAENLTCSGSKNHARITGKQGLYRKTAQKDEPSPADHIYCTPSICICQGAKMAFFSYILQLFGKCYAPRRRRSAVWARNSELVGLSPTEEARRPRAAR